MWKEILIPLQFVAGKKLPGKSILPIWAVFRKMKNIGITSANRKRTGIT
jgi:hypothetical protein